MLRPTVDGRLQAFAENSSGACDYCQGNEEDCPDCEGEVYYLKQKVLKREQLKSVVAAAFAFEELKIYNQVYDSLFDLSEYLF